jgi:hypothetical protein
MRRLQDSGEGHALLTCTRARMRRPGASPSTKIAHHDKSGGNTGAASWLAAACRIQVLSRQVGGEHVQVQLWDVAGDAQPLWPALAQVRRRCRTRTLRAAHRCTPCTPCAVTALRRTAVRHAGWTLQDVDGVLLVLDPHQPQQERALEQCYLRFAQPHNLTVKQCGVVAVSMVNADAASASASPPGWQGAWRWVCAGTGGASPTAQQWRPHTATGAGVWVWWAWSHAGLRGKLRKLQSAHVCLGGAGGPLQHSRQVSLLACVEGGRACSPSAHPPSTQTYVRVVCLHNMQAALELLDRLLAGARCLLHVSGLTAGTGTQGCGRAACGACPTTTPPPPHTHRHRNCHRHRRMLQAAWRTRRTSWSTPLWPRLPDVRVLSARLRCVACTRQLARKASSRGIMWAPQALCCPGTNWCRGHEQLLVWCLRECARRTSVG